MPKPGENAEHDQPCTNPGHAGQTYAQCGHTPGPWRTQEGADDYNDAILIVHGKTATGYVAHITLGEDYSPDRALANARLIAVAPEMLALLKQLVEGDDRVYAKLSAHAKAHFDARRNPNRLADLARALLARINKGE